MCYANSSVTYCYAQQRHAMKDDYAQHLDANNDPSTSTIQPTKQPKKGCMSV